VLSCAASSTNVGPGRPAILSMSAADAVPTGGRKTDALDTGGALGRGAGEMGSVQGAADGRGRGFSRDPTINLFCRRWNGTAH